MARIDQERSVPACIDSSAINLVAVAAAIEVQRGKSVVKPDKLPGSG